MESSDKKDSNVLEVKDGLAGIPLAMVAAVGGMTGPTLSGKSLTHEQKLKRLNKEGKIKLSDIEDRIHRIDNDNLAKMKDADDALQVEISAINRAMSDKVRPVREDKEKEIKFLKTKFEADSKSLQSKFNADVAKINVAIIGRMRQIEDDLNKAIALAKSNRDAKQTQIDMASQKTISDLKKDRDKILG